MYEHIYIIKKF